MIRSVIATLILSLTPHLATAQETSPKLAKLIAVTAGEQAVTRTFFGHVAARETVDLAFQVSGQIVDFPVIEGDPIPEGQQIAVLDLEPFELALEQAELEKDQADRTLERLQRLEGNTVSQVSVDDAETQANLAEIAVRNAERSLRHATLTAPFDALVARRHVANFTSVTAGAAIVRLHDMSELQVEIDVSEVLFQQAGRNPDVELTAKFPASEERFPLEIREFIAETSDIGQTFLITLGMTPPDDLVILPGSSVQVNATLRQQEAHIEIPSSAVLSGNTGQQMVMVFSSPGEGEGTVSLQTIEIEPTINGAVRVLSGLEPGQEIVASGAALLSDGELVRRFSGFPN